MNLERFLAIKTAATRLLPAVYEKCRTRGLDDPIGREHEIDQMVGECVTIATRLVDKLASRMLPVKTQEGEEE